MVRCVLVSVSGVAFDLHDENHGLASQQRGLIFSDSLVPPRCFYLASGLKTSDHQTERGEDRQKTHIYCHLFPAFPAQLLPLPVSVWRENAGVVGGVVAVFGCGVL